MTSVLEAIRYRHDPKPSLDILDQLQLPHKTHYLSITSSEDGWKAIKSMSTRGAPAIAIVAALSLAVELANRKNTKLQDAKAARDYIKDKLTYLVTSRPTAVNLEDAARKLNRLVETEAEKEGSTASSLIQRYTTAAEAMLIKDVEDNEAIGLNGAEWLIQHVESSQRRKLNVITHCNTGSLATAGYGTALGVIRGLKTKDKLNHAYCTETRPYNQGSRLTAYELMHDQIESTLITDSMAGALMRMKKDGDKSAVDAIVVGADRVTGNGDTANKIGTYALAVLAKHHGVKFLVAAPRTSIDLGKRSGDEIEIEHRPQNELTYIRGPVFNDGDLTDQVASVSTAPQGMNVWNPSFDVTPAELIDGIVTESGVIEKAPGGTEFEMQKFFDEQ